jgi:hypothetical protein
VPECHGCGTILPPKKRKWCSDDCRKREARRKHLWDHFRITLEEYDLIVAEQGGKCAICKTFPKSGRSLAVDHAHTVDRSGPVRGALCFRCNKRLIGARSDKAILAMAEYVNDPPAQRALGRVVIAPGRPRKIRRRKKK